MTEDPKIAELRAKRAEALQGGGADKNAQQHKRGRLTPPERLAQLLDKGSIRVMDMFVTHREREFGLDQRKTLGDSVVFLLTTIPLLVGNFGPDLI